MDDVKGGQQEPLFLNNNGINVFEFGFKGSNNNGNQTGSECGEHKPSSFLNKSSTPAKNDRLNNNPSGRYFVDRPAHNEEEFRKNISGPELTPEVVSLRERMQKCVDGCTKKNAIKCCMGLFPIMNWLSQYNVRQSLPGDLVAGLTVGVVHIPQSMAFSLLAGLPPVFGLYTSFYPVLIYTFMGTSHHISVGTFAVTSLLTQAVVIRQVPDNPVVTAMVTNTTEAMMMQDITTATSGMSDITMRRIAVASSLMFLMGLFQLFFGIFRLGYITTYLADPLIQAFTTGAAIHVVTSQTPSILGIRIASSSGIGGIFKNWIEIFKNLPSTHVPTLVISIVCIILLVMGREVNLRFKDKMKVPIPTEVIVVIIATLSSHFGMFQSRFDVAVVDNIPTGLPAPRLPNFSILGSIIGDAFAIAIVGFAISVSLAKMYAQKYGYQIDSNQELIAYGVSNIFPSFFLCFPNAAALARCVIQENTGGKTQVVGIISVFIVLITILWLGPIFEPLPRAVLGCIIIVGLFGILQQLSQLKSIYKMSKFDFVIWIGTLLFVVTHGVDMGLLGGVIFAILTVIVRTQNPKCEVLGSVGGTDIYRSCKTYSSAIPQSGLIIFKFQSSLYYANKDVFKQKLITATGFDPDIVISERKKQAENENQSQTQSGLNCFRRKTYKLKQVDESNRDDTACDRTDRIEHGTPSNDECSNACSVELQKAFHTIIIDCTTMAFIDLAGVKTLKTLCKSYKELEITLLLAGASADIRQSLLSCAYYGIADPSNEFISVHDAVVYAQHANSDKTEELSQI